MIYLPVRGKYDICFAYDIRSADDICPWQMYCEKARGRTPTTVTDGPPPPEAGGRSPNVRFANLLDCFAILFPSQGKARHLIRQQS